MPMNPTWALVRAGIAGQVAFAVTFLAEDATREGFEPWRRWVSHLSLGTGGWVNTVGLAVAGAAGVAAALGARRGLARGAAGRLVPPAIAVYALGMATAAAFPIDPGLGWPPGVEPRHTLSGQLHDLSGLLVFAGLTASTWAGRRALRSPAEPGSRWRTWSTIAGSTVPACFLICCGLVSLDHSGSWPGAPSGLFERIALLTGMAWLVTYLVRHDRALRATTHHHEPDAVQVTS